MSFQSLLWFFPIVVTLHNAEEAIWFPEWTQRTRRWPAPSNRVSSVSLL